ncbi:MAG: peptidylprolyl isomerase [Candidatus Altiarchaeales archaeon]|nr:peptidylprolyl isomerase [Candidatus Altiarchaeales archaeon]MBD3416627.1 peptidylprolyl isomerase [Candidatus Altiarchaeales archaeon]
MDFIKINYTGRIKDGAVFDTTRREDAEKEGIFDERRVYKPFSVAVGEGQVVEGLDEALAKMKVGEKKTVTIEPEKAYGPRNPSMVKLIPIKQFKQQRINPIPGMPVEIDNMRGRVQTVAGGRVRVDFNHELAGKTIEFDVEVVEKAKTDTDKVNYILERAFESSDEFESKLTANKLTVKLPKSANYDQNLLMRKMSFTAEAFKLLKVDDVVFEETWENPEKKKKEKSDSGDEKSDDKSEEKTPKKSGKKSD